MSPTDWLILAACWSLIPLCLVLREVLRVR